MTAYDITPAATTPTDQVAATAGVFVVKSEPSQKSIKDSIIQMVRIALDMATTLNEPERAEVMESCWVLCRPQIPVDPAVRADLTAHDPNQRLAQGVQVRQDASWTSSTGGSDGSTKTSVLDDEWLDAEQVAAYLQLSPKAVRDGANRGKLPGHKYPANSKRGRWLFRKSELDKTLTKPARQRRLVEQSILWS